MDVNTKDIQLQYEGYLNTPLLWKSTPVFGLNQLYIPTKKIKTFEGSIAKNLRLGKRVERFVKQELNQHSSISILTENNQIQHKKTTVGEIDFIIKKDEKPIHLEVIYKFYLYDETIGNSELEHWIGPNRNDNLVKKLTKLKEKQLPLLYTIHSKPLLKKLDLNIKNITQLVYFKAQLFVPFHQKNITLNLINKECVKGFYIGLKELVQFKDCKFYIPSKINWLQEPKSSTNWLTHKQFSPLIETLLNKQITTLCWVKKPNGELTKLFIVWWN